MKVLLPVLFFLSCFVSGAQYADAQNAYNNASSKLVSAVLPATYAEYALKANSVKKLYQRNSGMIIGLQKGRSTAIELGGEFHWRKMSVFNKPHIIGATANIEYNFSEHIIGYKAGMWWKRGRVNLTYGGNVSYYDNFKGSSRYGIGPSIGFRLVGFHFITGYTFLTNDKGTEKETPMQVNTLYTSLRYYFPVENKFTWDRKTMKKKRERRKERAKKKEERQSGERGIKKLLNIGPANKEKKKEPEEGEKKGLRKIFNLDGQNKKSD